MSPIDREVPSDADQIHRYRTGSGRGRRHPGRRAEGLHRRGASADACAAAVQSGPAVRAAADAPRAGAQRCRAGQPARTRDGAVVAPAPGQKRIPAGAPRWLTACAPDPCRHKRDTDPSRGTVRLVRNRERSHGRKNFIVRVPRHLPRKWDEGASREEIQQAIDQFYAWHDRLVDEGTMKPRHRLANEGRLVSRNRVTDGPFAEAKEVIGGYWFILAGSPRRSGAHRVGEPCLPTACPTRSEPSTRRGPVPSWWRPRRRSRISSIRRASCRVPSDIPAD